MSDQGSSDDARRRDGARAYDGIADEYAGPLPVEEDPELREACREAFCRRLPGPRVLEIGCGPGVDAAAFAARGLQVTATDACERFVAIAAERFPHLTVRLMDMRAPDLPAASFDGIYGFASFVHVPRDEADATLAALGTLLVPGGVLFLSLIESDRLEDYVIDDWGGVPDNPLLFTCMSPAEIAARLERAGFSASESLRIPSRVYDTLPRLVERGVRMHQVLAVR